MLETLAGAVERDASADMIDDTIVWAHHCAVGIKRAQEAERLGRSRGGFTTKLHTRCDAEGRPFAFFLVPGQAHDVQGFGLLIRMIADRSDALLADNPVLVHCWQECADPVVG